MVIHTRLLEIDRERLHLNVFVNFAVLLAVNASAKGVFIHNFVIGALRCGLAAAAESFDFLRLSSLTLRFICLFGHSTHVGSEYLS